MDGDNYYTACPVGTYKASVSNISRCIPCPINSTTLNEASAACEYIRGTIRDPKQSEDPCIDMEESTKSKYFTTTLIMLVVESCCMMLLATSSEVQLCL